MSQPHSPAISVSVGSKGSMVSNAEHTVEKHPDGTIEKSRANGYQSVLPLESKYSPVVQTMVLGAVLSFFATPQGVWCILWVVNWCSGFRGAEFAADSPALAVVIGTVATAISSIATFIPFARYYYSLYAKYKGLRCQPNRTHNNLLLTLKRPEVRQTVTNLTIAAFLSACVVVGKVKYDYSRIYTDVTEYGGDNCLLYFLVSTVAYFIWIDLWAYIGHRALHLPFLYKTVHKYHHKYQPTTAFAALGLHPVDMLIIQGGVYTMLYVMPMHVGCIALNLLYVHYHNVIDHSGIYHESALPWQPSSLYHDDHHKLFHLNYGQTLTIWDKLGKTFYKDKKTYSEDTFSW